MLLRRSAAMANAQGVDCEPLTPQQAGDKYPDHAHRRPGGRGVAAGRRQGQSRRHHPGAGPRRAHRRRAHLREDPRDRGRHQGRPRHRRADAPRARSRPRSSSIAPASGRASSAAWSASRCRSIPASTCTSSPRRWRRAARPAGDARSRRLHLLQGGGRRPPDGRLRARGQAVEQGRHPRRFRVRHAARRLGPVPDPDGQRADPRPGAGEDRHQDVHERPGELYARHQLHPGRGAAAEGLLRRRGLQLDGHRQLGRRRHGAGRMDRGRRADARSVAGRHPPLRAASTATTPGCATGSPRRSACTTRWCGRSASRRAAGRSAARRSTTG